jgi:hypothetical protein
LITNDLSCRKVEGRAFRLLGELARRKVVLLQIDSGAKVIETGGSPVSRMLASLAPVIFRPVQALNNTTYTNAELWTLGAEDKAQVRVQFLIEWDRQSPVLMKALEIESRVRISPPNSRPGEQPHVDRAPVLAREYQAFVSGQNLADRARAEFYQMLSTEPGSAVAPAGQSTLVIDEAARADMENYEMLFRTAVPGRRARRVDAPTAPETPVDPSASPIP